MTREGCWGFVFKVFVFGIISAAVLLLAGVLTLSYVLDYYSQGLPDVAKLREIEPAESSYVYSSDGTLLVKLFQEDRKWTYLEDISPWVMKALVAVEDSRFYEHTGVDYWGVARAAYHDIKAGYAQQGASTLTMQLARNLFLNQEKKLGRKIREVLIAFEIEKTFAKDDIIELYLNQIFFGSGAHGIGQAAEIYFHKPAKDLTLAESALIAGLPQAPSDLSPLVNRDAALVRQEIVLSRMVAVGDITEEQKQEALEESKSFVFKENNQTKTELLKYPYFTTYVLSDLFRRYDDSALYHGGLNVFTTLDTTMQERALSVVRDVMAANAKRVNADTAALVCIENKTGYVRAMVGGLGWNQNNQFNRAWQALRQPGSSFKPFVYSAYLEDGYSPNSVVDDSKVVYNLAGGEVWEPKNADHSYMGPIPIKTALQYSRNIIAVKLIEAVRPDRVIKLAYEAGITQKLPPLLSLALGTIEVSPLEMASAYTIFPNKGVKLVTTPVKKVEDSSGTVVEEWFINRKKEVITEATARNMTWMMRRVVTSGTAKQAQVANTEVAGKTGTTDESRDTWFVGYSPEYTVAVWVGRDDNGVMNRAFGGDVPAAIFSRFMSRVMQDKKDAERGFFRNEKGQVTALVCVETKKQARSVCFNVAEVGYNSVAEFPTFCNRHGKNTHHYLPEDEGGPNPDVIPAPLGPPATVKPKEHDEGPPNLGDPHGKLDVQVDLDAPRPSLEDLSDEELEGVNL